VKVILKEDIVSLGIEGNVLDVADGYARNYLLPKGLAVVASPGNLKDFEFRRKAIAKKEAARKIGSEEHAKLFEGKKITVIAKVAEEGKLYGSVTVTDVVNAVEEQLRQTLDKRQVVVQDHIKEVGTYPVIIRLHPEVEVTIDLEVQPESGEIAEKKEEEPKAEETENVTSSTETEESLKEPEKTEETVEETPEENIVDSTEESEAQSSE
jgi:large subunit ribosomal protein L9